ncbi:glycosyltransferase family 2 protein [Clostridium sp. 001]|uniref:glycosyltransferase family 2 protein n=1 Tax=Clostridium sp. 001 TaxID=1970093 RepID=UPI001C2C336B|nr:glycosyltransferase family 2 protein [Clostridium sp. 001]QXE18504.1 glycosyl transferase [Clostridium sp. 001]
MYNKDTVSIIIPVYNEEIHIEKCLNSIINQTYDNIIEILVLDGMSTDSTRDIIGKFENEKIKIVDNPQKIQSAGLNKGIKMAEGDIVVRVDGHALYDKNYVSECVSTLNKLKSQNVVNVGGPTYLLTSKSYIENCIVFLHESKFGIGVAKFRQKDYQGFVDTVWNGAFWRWVFDKVGLYNESLARSEDNDMNNRILKAGYKIYQNKDIISYYKPRSSVKKIISQNFANGKEIGGSLITNREIVRIRHLVPLIFLLTILLFGATYRLFLLSKVIEILALGSYFLVDILECIKIGSKNGIKYMPLMFILFFLLHIAYGAGTAVGFFKSLVLGRSK